VKQRVRITRKDCGKFTGMIGFLEYRDGDYFYIRPRWYKHQIELYQHEFEVISK